MRGPVAALSVLVVMLAIVNGVIARPASATPATPTAPSPGVSYPADRSIRVKLAAPMGDGLAALTIDANPKRGDVNVTLTVYGVVTTTAAPRMSRHLDQSGHSSVSVPVTIGRGSPVGYLRALVTQPGSASGEPVNEGADTVWLGRAADGGLLSSNLSGVDVEHARIRHDARGDKTVEQEKLHEFSEAVPSDVTTRVINAQAAPDQIEFSGIVQYEDRDGGIHPARGVEVEAALLPHMSPNGSTTDDNGHYSFVYGVPPGSDSWSGEIRFLAKSSAAAIETGGVFSDQYKVTSSFANLPAGASYVGNFLARRNGGPVHLAFAIHDAVLGAARYAQKLRGSDLPQIGIHFPIGTSQSRYVSAPSGWIDIGDLDWSDWDVIGHEYGHYVADEAGIDSSLTFGDHCSNSNLSEHVCASAAGLGKADGTALAWREGWATFFGLSAEFEVVGPNVPDRGDTDYQDRPIDSNNQIVPLGTVDDPIERPVTALQSTMYHGEDNEVSVARVLWDLWDFGASDRDADGLALSATRLWSLLASERPNRLSHAVAAVRRALPTDQDLLVGCTLSQQRIAPYWGPDDRPNDVAERAATLAAPLTFNWSAGNGDLAFHNDRFQLQATDSWGTVIFSSPTLTTPTWTPTGTQWPQMFAGRSAIQVRILGWQSTAPETGPFPGCAMTVRVVRSGVANIMVVGDSISQGAEGDFTWRYRLDQHLNANGVIHDFVGPFGGTRKIPSELPTGWPAFPGPPDFSGGYRDGPFDSDHLAQWGWQAAQAKYDIQSKVNDYQPDYLLVELGFNDLGWWVSDPDGLIASMRELVGNARAAKPDIKILIANVVHRTYLSVNPQLGATIDAYNAKLGPALQALSSGVSRVESVDISSGYDPTVDAYDGLHPTGIGEYKIAQAFGNVLSSQFGVGNGFGTIPSSVLPLTPTAPSWLHAVATNSGIHVTWEHTFGATGYWIYSRNVTDATAWSLAAQIPIPADGWTANWVLTGKQYEFSVVAARGDASSTSSPTGSAVANTKTAGGPTNIVVMPAVDHIDLRWDPPTDVNSGTVSAYNVLYFDQSCVGCYLSSQLTSGTSVRLTNVIDGHRYTFAVESVNAYGPGWPSAAPVAAIAGVGRPDVATARAAQILSPTDVEVRWSSTPSATSYRILNRDVVAGGPFVQVAEVDQPYPLTVNTLTRSHQFGWLFPGADRWEWCVVAVNASLEATPSCLRSQLDAPTLESARLIDGASVDIRWTSVPGADNYNVLIRDFTVVGSQFSVAAPGVTGTSHQIGWLFPATNYEFCVVAERPTVESPPSNCVRATW